MNGKYQVGSGRIVAITHDTPFIEDIVQQDGKKSQVKNSTRENLEIASVMADRSMLTQGESAALDVFRTRLDRRDAILDQRDELSETLDLLQTEDVPNKEEVLKTKNRLANLLPIHIQMRV